MRLCLAALYGTLLAASVMHAQQPKVVVVSSDSKDLKRTAYRLRMRAGRKEDAVDLINQTVTDLASVGVSRIEPSDLTDLTQTLVRVAPDRFPEAFRLIVTSSADMPAGGAPSVKIGNDVVFLDNSEAVALNLLKDIQQRPTLVTEVMDTMPELKSKLEPVGGIDAILSGGPVELSYGSQGALETTTFYGPDASYGDQQLYAQLHGADSETVREKLSAITASPAQIHELFNLAYSAAVEDPDLSSKALEQARKLLERIEPLTDRAPLFAQMFRVSRRCDGEVDPELYKQGIALVAEIRDEEADQVKQGGRASSPVSSRADMLEQALISELAVDHFEAAVKYTRKIPEERVRLSVLRAVVAACESPRLRSVC